MIRLLLLVSLLVAVCSARPNPFEPVDVTDQQINTPKKGVDLNNPHHKNRTVKIITDQKETQKESKKKVISKSTKSKKTKYNKKVAAKSFKMKKTLANNKKASATKYKVLPLVTIDLVGDNLSISTQNNYKLIKYYEDSKDDKFVFDFKASVGVPTERSTINSPYYDSYTVGNHPQDGFFRVVIPVKDGVSKYKVLIKDNKATIIRK